MRDPLTAEAVQVSRMVCDPPTVRDLFWNVRKNYFRLFFHYMYFDVAKWSYLQFGVLVPLATWARRRRTLYPR